MYSYNKILDDCYSLDLKKNKWEPIDCKINDKLLDGRAYHSASLIGNFIFYFGGIKKNRQFTDEVIILLG